MAEFTGPGGIRRACFKLNWLGAHGEAELRSETDSATIGAETAFRASWLADGAKRCQPAMREVCLREVCQ